MKQLDAAHLAVNLSSHLAPSFILAGQDHLLLDEARRFIREKAKQEGFTELQQVSIDANTNWEQLYALCQSRGLFFERTLLVLNLPDSFTQALLKKWDTLLPQLHQDILSVLVVSKFTFQTEKQAWYQKYKQWCGDKHIIVNCQTPTYEQLPNWLKQRCKTEQIEIDREAVQFLCYSYEGNLLALAQILRLLKLRYPDEKLTYYKVQNCVEQSAQFTPYQWLDALLLGKIHRAFRILATLREEDVQPLVLLRSAQRELITLLRLIQNSPVTDSHLPISLHNLRTQFDKLRIWQSRRDIYQQALQRFSYARLYGLIEILADLERQLKQDFETDPWQLLEQFSLKFAD